MRPYLCLLLRMYCAYADWGMLNFIYLNFWRVRIKDIFVY